MTTISKHKRSLTFYLGLLFFAVALTGCSGGLLGNENWRGISVDEDNVYISLGPNVHVVDIETEKEICRFPEEPERGINFFAPPMPVNQNLVIVGDFSGIVYGIDISDNCEELWRAEISDDFIIGGPVVFNETVLVPSADGTLYAYNFYSNSTSLKWEFPTESALWSSPLVSGDVIYQSSMDHHVYAINVHNGNLIWKEDLGAAILDTPTETEDMLLIGTFGNQLIALDKERGEIKWSFSTEAWVWGNPLVIDGTAYFGDADGNIYFVNINSGREARNREKLDGAIISSPVATEDRLFFLTEAGTLYAWRSSDFTPDGKPSLGGPLYSDPVIQNGIIYVSVNKQDEPLQAINADSSVPIWAFPPAEEQ